MFFKVLGVIMAGIAAYFFFSGDFDYGEASIFVLMPAAAAAACLFLGFDL